MKYLLVDMYDNITTSVELASGVGVSGAKTYFIGIKKLDENKFDGLWKVMSEKEYAKIYKLHTRKSSSSEYKWWKEENTNLDDF